MSEEIIVLSDKDKVRDMINLYHGSAENHINMIKELIGNSLDIFKKNFPNRNNNKIEIIIHNSNKIEFIDNASGIPVEGTASDGRTNYEAIFEKDCAGSNYSKETDTVGQHGIFLYTLSMSSENIEYFIARPNNKVYNIKYHKGDRVSELNIVDESKTTYSKIIFSLDKEVWNNPVFTFEEVCNIAQGQASLINVEISVTDIVNNLSKNFFYEEGIENFFTEMTLDKIMISENIRITKEIVDIFKKKGTNKDLTDKIKIDMIFNYSNDSNEDFQKEFLNTADLIQHGTIQDGIILGFKSSIEKWIVKNNKYLKNEKHITNDDIIVGLNYLCNFSGLYVEYENQIKQRTLNKRYKTILKEVIEEYMEVLFIENHLMGEKICMQILVNSRARLSADKTRQNIKKKLQGESKLTFGKIEGLTDCDKNTPFEEREIWLCEGLSACSTLTDSRDDKTMATFPLSGRFINSLKSFIRDVLNNAPAFGIIQALGCGIEAPYEERNKFKGVELFDKNKLKFSKIIIATDADSFGHGITLSLLAFFYRFMPTLLKECRIYISVSPRYQITYKGKFYFAYSEEEKNKIVEKYNIDSNSNQISIIKGLGQLNKDVFWEYVMNPKNRILKCVTYEDFENEEEVKFYFDTLIGEDISNRKKYVKEFITNTNINEIE